MKDNINMLEVYKYSKRHYKIITPIAIIFPVIIAIILFFVLPQAWWIGLVFLGIALMDGVILLFVHKHLDAKIRRLEQEQQVESN